jgi:hypothetical protein
LRERNSTHDNSLEGRVKRNYGPVQPQGKLCLFLLQKEKKLPWIMRKSFLAKARTEKNFCRPPNGFALGALGVERFTLHLYLWSAFNGPDRTDIRAGSAVGTEVRVDSGAFLPVGNRLQGTDREAVPAMVAFFGDLVGHKNSYQRSAISRQTSVQNRQKGLG